MSVTTRPRHGNSSTPSRRRSSTRSRLTCEGPITFAAACRITAVGAALARHVLEAAPAVEAAPVVEAVEAVEAAPVVEAVEAAPVVEAVEAARGVEGGPGAALSTPTGSASAEATVF